MKKKLNLNLVLNKMSRYEMKQIMAGSGGNSYGSCCIICSGTPPNEVKECEECGTALCTSEAAEKRIKCGEGEWKQKCLA
jgi:hypothetical protein